MIPGQPSVGIRREDKNEWERRVPLAPEQVARLVREEGIGIAVQPSKLRVFPDEAYLEAGAEVLEELGACDIVMGVKEMPAGFFRPDGAYAFFSHVIKGQAWNMPMLARLVSLRCNLVDYEKIVDPEGRRLVAFGRFAGLAGMVNTLHGLGLRLAAEGIPSPFSELKQARVYGEIDSALQAVRLAGRRLRMEGLPDGLVPLVFGVAGYGKVARGALEVLDALGAVDVPPEQLPYLVSRAGANACYRTVFREEHMVEPAEPGRPFDLQEYYQHPERYRPTLEEKLPYLTTLTNCIYWEDRYPRLVTKAWLRGETERPGRPLLRVIGDISCDVEGGIEATVRTTDSGSPFFVYSPADGSDSPGVEGDGIVIMAVDNLPCEFPAASSRAFGEALLPFIPGMARADFGSDDPGLPEPVRPALLLHRGRLTPSYEYLLRFLKQQGS